MKIKNILLSAILMASVSVASAKESVSNELIFGNVNVVQTINLPGQPFNPRQLCLDGCQSSYNVCMSNAVTPWQVDGCSVKLEVCNHRCTINGINF